MRVAWNDSDDRAGLRGHVQFDKYAYIHTFINAYISPWEHQCEWHRMTRMTGPDCAVTFNLKIKYIHTYIHTYVVMCNLINTYIHTYIHTHIHTYIHTYMHIIDLPLGGSIRVA